MSGEYGGLDGRPWRCVSLFMRFVPVRVTVSAMPCLVCDVFVDFSGQVHEQVIRRGVIFVLARRHDASGALRVGTKVARPDVRMLPPSTVEEIRQACQEAAAGTFPCRWGFLVHSPTTEFVADRLGVGYRFGP